MKFNNENIRISPNAQIGKNVKIGDHTIIYDNVKIGDNVIIANHCVIGEPLHSYYWDEKYENPVTYIGNNSLIRSHTIIYAGSKLGAHLNTGHRVTVREYTIAGEHCSFGSYTDIQGFVKLGNFNRFHSFVNIGQNSETGDFVFVYPYVVFTNDPTPPSEDLKGPYVGSYSQILTGAILLPGVRIGNHCMVAANAVAGGNFSDDLLIQGNPAKVIGKLSKMPLFNSKGKRHYPWPYHFDRGMPWKGIGYDEWLKNQKE